MEKKRKETTDTGYTARQTETSSGSKGVSGEGKDSGRCYIDCSEAGSKDCSLRISGTFDEVLEAGVSHGKAVHGMKGDDSKLREDVKSYIKPEKSFGGADFPETYQSRGESQAGRSPGLPS